MKQTRRCYSIQGVNAKRQKLPTHVDGQRTPKTLVLMNAILLGLKNPMVYQKSSVWKRTKIHLKCTGSLRLLPTSIITNVKDRLCKLSSQDWQQSQPYSKGQLRFTSYKKSTDKMKNQERDTAKIILSKKRME